MPAASLLIDLLSRVPYALDENVVSFMTERLPVRTTSRGRDRAPGLSEPSTCTLAPRTVERALDAAQVRKVGEAQSLSAIQEVRQVKVGRVVAGQDVAVRLECHEGPARGSARGGTARVSPWVDLRPLPTPFCGTSAPFLPPRQSRAKPAASAPPFQKTAPRRRRCEHRFPA